MSLYSTAVEEKTIKIIASSLYINLKGELGSAFKLFKELHESFTKSKC